MLQCDICEDLFKHLTLDVDKNNKDILVCGECRKKLSKKIIHRKYVDIKKTKKVS